MNTVTTNLFSNNFEFGNIVFIEGYYYILTSIYIEDKQYAALVSLDSGNIYDEPHLIKEDTFEYLQSRLRMITKDYTVFKNVDIKLNL